MLAARIITAAVFGLAITAAILLAPPIVTAGVLGLLWLAGAWEWGGFARLDGLSRFIYTAAVVAVMLLGWRWLGPPGTLALLGIALVWWVSALVLVLRFPRSFSSPFVAVAGVLVLVPSWTLLVRLHGAGELGPWLAFLVLLIVWAADVGAFVFGRWLGRTKLAPAVSPGKTWEGVAGGLLAAGVTAGAAAFWLGLPWGWFVALGVATAVISVLGDLTQSMFKRNVGLKDSGRLLPGHGGILDRIDSLTAAVPLFVLGLSILGVGG
jgi:phosphatidate cytidylyltransferase